MIRPAEDRDFDAIAAITNHYIATSTIHFGYEPVTAESLRAYVKPRYPWFVAEAGGIVRGYAKAGTYRDRAAYDWTTELGLYIDAAWRGRGLGKALYAALIDEVTRIGFRSAMAGITMPNDASIALHRAFGFQRVGVVRDAGYKHGRWNDIELWQKRLSTSNDAPSALP